jgi:hypothetical protein
MRFGVSAAAQEGTPINITKFSPAIYSNREKEKSEWQGPMLRK